MKDCIVLLNYPESDWGTDLVCFTIPECHSANRLMDELRCQRADLQSADYDCIQSMADALCTKVANALGGQWKFVSQCSSFDISCNDDEEVE